MKKLNHKLFQFKIENEKQQIIKGGDGETQRLTWPWNDTNMNKESSSQIDLNTGWPKDVTTTSVDSPTG